MRNPLYLVCALVAAFVFTPNADAARLKKERTVHGVIKEIKADKDKDAGEITLTIHKKKKGGTGIETEDKTFRVHEGTSIELVSGKKGDVKTEKGNFKDLKDGKHVAVIEESGKVTEIKIHEGKAKK
jgi:hypothetical protein